MYFSSFLDSFYYFQSLMTFFQNFNVKKQVTLLAFGYEIAINLKKLKMENFVPSKTQKNSEATKMGAFDLALKEPYGNNC